MRSGLACILGLTGLALTNASSVEKRDSLAVLAVPIVRDTSRQLSKRSTTLDDDLDNEDANKISYVANVTFGTPPQHFLAYLHTWGNGCWLKSVDNPDCGLYVNRSLCGGYGGYNMTTSTTAKKLDEIFVYDDSGSMMGGDFVNDVLTIGGVTMDTMKMGIVTEHRIIAILDTANTSSTSLTQALADAGTINSPAFSLWDQTALFGGVNKAKYDGPLYTFPIVNGSDLTKALRINMDGSSVNETSAASKEFPLDAVFDTAVGMTYVPKSVAQALNAQIGNTSVPDKWGQVNFSCSAVGENSTINFKFGELDFLLYLSYFVSQERHTASQRWVSGEETCYFTICENTNLQFEASIVLGSNFISKVYAVFDLENDEISLAQRSWNYATDNIVEITSGKDGVPGAKKGSGGTDKNGASEPKNSAGMRIKKAMGMSALVVGTAVLIVIL
ncbi:hypothetical protein PENFLA_c038G09363 [Penicillium flavigenum]|uniref:Peptidase A1 domain-containing protein n=1 Tax=Penicillium flavigenum TaxID=254877 RepID=A0A1V6SKI1_9EURO|nr:hypothetical protein PENFLA_c038G09363 [Penicillium flavigenum]